jgi:hypothetical protein
MPGDTYHIDPPAKRVKSPKVHPTAQAVYQQLLPDFPPSALQFIKRNQWYGPVEVPLDQIDFSNRDTWTASHEPKKVNQHTKLIAEHESNPVILAILPGHDKLVCLDAHHRLLAYEKLQQPAVAYVGAIRPADTEAALTMHAVQFHGQSRLYGTQGSVKV